MSPQEFQSTVRTLKNRLFRYALSLVGHEAEAADVVQEVFIRMWNYCKDTDAILNPEAWCLTTTKNLCFDKLKSKHKRMEPMKAGFDFRDKSPTPFQETLQNDVFEKVNELINQLPEKQQDVVRLRDIENMSYQEIAEHLDLTIDQVKINIHRARQSLRQSLLLLNLTTAV